MDIDAIAIVIGKISYVILAIGLFSYGLFMRVIVMQAQKEVPYWREVKEKGLEFLKETKDTWELAEFSALPDTMRCNVITQLGYEVDMIDDFVEWAESDPDILEVDARIVDRWFQGYKNTRRAMRGANWLGGWRVG